MDHAVRAAVGTIDDFQRLDPQWLAALKLHAATLSLAEFAAVIGNLRAARFGRDSAGRTAALFGALDEVRHTQIPLLLMHELVRWDRQFDRSAATPVRAGRPIRRGSRCAS